MKAISYFISSLLLITIFSCGNQNSPLAPDNSVDPESNSITPIDSTKLTSIQWLDSNLNFTNIKEGEKLEVAFRYLNSGNNPLVIVKVNPSCGCTAATPPKEPILPGKEGVIKATFDSKGRVGLNNKTLYVEANTINEPNHTLHFTVDVIEEKK